METTSHVTPEQIAAHAGVDLAYEANKAYDSHDPRFHKIAETAGDLMGRGSLGESAVDSVFVQPGSQTTSETAQTAESLGQLTPEQQKKVDGSIAAMAEKFGVKPEEFSVLRTTAEDGREGIVVAHTAPNGIYKGSWNKIMDKKSNKDFIVEVDGQQIDTRTGMTRSVYRAFIAEARANGVDPLPDSSVLSKQNGEPWTATWLTGGQAGGLAAPRADVNEGRVRERWFNRGNDYQRVRLRPAVVIE